MNINTKTTPPKTGGVWKFVKINDILYRWIDNSLGGHADIVDDGETVTQAGMVFTFEDGSWRFGSYYSTTLKVGCTQEVHSDMVKMLGDNERVD